MINERNFVGLIFGVVGIIVMLKGRIRLDIAMPRQARLDARGVLHHVMARGIEQGLIFRDDRDRDDFVRRLSKLAEKEERGHACKHANKTATGFGGSVSSVSYNTA